MSKSTVRGKITDQFFMELAQIGWKSLSPREREVAVLACRGLNSIQISQTLNTRHETVKTQTKKIMLKMGLGSMTAVVAYAIRFQGVEPTIREIYDSSDRWKDHL